jgi:hypothetical protein
VIRWAAVLGASVALLLAASASAESEQPPTELWSEYPLVQEVERDGSASVGPFLPPVDPGAGAEAVAGDGTTPLAVWLVAITLGLLAILAITRVTLLAAPSARREQRPHAVRLRPAPRGSWRSPTSRPLAQYAPTDESVPDVESGDEPRRSVVRRTGILRSRFVVVADAMAGDFETVTSSRSFWNVGRDTSRERAAEDAWDALLNDLRAAGWEPDPARRSDYYALLRPIASEQSSIVPTIEAYHQRPDRPDGD